MSEPGEGEAEGVGVVPVVGVHKSQPKRIPIGWQWCGWDEVVGEVVESSVLGAVEGLLHLDLAMLRLLEPTKKAKVYFHELRRNKE